MSIMPGTRGSVRPVGVVLIGLLASTLASYGCSMTSPDRQERLPRGYVYYLDGAGGAGLLANWSRGVRQGLIDAGYSGAGEVFVWQTRLGVWADQNASVWYKKTKASELARRIKGYSQDYPEAPVNVMGLSAGTAVALYAAEALPSDYPVDNVVLLSSSVSNDYDLTKALQRIDGKLYVFTSERDDVLQFLVPISGTADRAGGETPSAGLRGFRLPRGASAETRKLYAAKVVRIAWRPEFERYGYGGGHTDVVSSRFVQAYVAPLVMETTRMAARPTTAPAGMVRNPDYARWEKFGVGTWTAAEGYQVVGGQRRRVRMTAKLVTKHPDKIVIQRDSVTLDQGPQALPVPRQFIADAWIRPEDHPRTDPKAVVKESPNERLTVKGKSLDCTVRDLRAYGDYPEWGRDITARIHSNPELPGGLARLYLKAYKGTQPFEVHAQVVDYGITPQ